MNYIRELNAFRNWLLLNEMPTSEIVLWHALMSINNMCGWQTTFSVANSRLQHLTGLSKQGLDNARTGLKNKRFIEYEKGQRRKPGKYRMNSLVNSLDQNIDQTVDLTLDQTVDHSLTITKQNKTKPTPSTSSPSAQEDFGEIFRMYESEGFGPLSELVREVVTESVKSYSGAWVRQALAEAVFSGKRSWRYVEAILKTWRAEGGPDEAKAKHEAAHSAIDIQTRRSRNKPVPAQDDRYENFYKLFPNG